MTILKYNLFSLSAFEVNLETNFIAFGACGYAFLNTLIRNNKAATCNYDVLNIDYEFEPTKLIGIVK